MMLVMPRPPCASRRFPRATARARPWNSGVEAEAIAKCCRLNETDQARRLLGHLDGWGLGDAAQMRWFQRSRGNSHRPVYTG